MQTWIIDRQSDDDPAFTLWNLNWRGNNWLPLYLALSRCGNFGLRITNPLATTSTYVPLHCLDFKVASLKSKQTIFGLYFTGCWVPRSSFSCSEVPDLLPIECHTIGNDQINNQLRMKVVSKRNHLRLYTMYSSPIVPGMGFRGQGDLSLFGFSVLYCTPLLHDSFERHFLAKCTELF